MGVVLSQTFYMWIIPTLTAPQGAHGVNKSMRLAIRSETYFRMIRFCAMLNLLVTEADLESTGNRLNGFCLRPLAAETYA
ncbi:hypothetical protein BV25DRAFT_1831687 [Artomyces pyxidatus]|uniref:Uncharacterized protein n=1 Tax=Artomyces pyxidatus TaxID=48021 RepID=A0ACB8SK32_9AGAM|nr:hypothetical protein BV25DRAFT_1831687 [Artomyces pyxidatus]